MKLVLTAGGKKEYVFVFLAAADFAGVLFALNHLVSGRKRMPLFVKPTPFLSHQLEAVWREKLQETKDCFESVKSSSVQPLNRPPRLLAVRSFATNHWPQVEVTGSKSVEPAPLDFSRILQDVLRANGAANWQPSESARKRQQAETGAPKASPRGACHPRQLSFDNRMPEPVKPETRFDGSPAHSPVLPKQRVVVHKLLEASPNPQPRNIGNRPTGIGLHRLLTVANTSGLSQKETKPPGLPCDDGEKKGDVRRLRAPHLKVTLCLRPSQKKSLGVSQSIGPLAHSEDYRREAHQESPADSSVACETGIAVAASQ